MDDIENPYDPPDSGSAPMRSPRRTTIPTIILRNGVMWTGSLLAYCVLDYFYVRHGQSHVVWAAELMFLPAFFFAMLWANKDLFCRKKDGPARWFAVGAVTLLIVLASGFVLFTLGVWFHFSIGGTL